MDLANLSETLLSELLGRSNEWWPKAAIDVSDLSVNESAYKDILRVADCSRRFKDFVASGMLPPTSTNWSAGDLSR